MTTSNSTQLLDLSTRPQVADYLQITVSTLDKWAGLGIGPKRIKIGRAVRYRRDDVLDYISDERRTA